MAGCYTGKHLNFPIARTAAVVSALDFFEIPQAIRPKGVVAKAALQQKHDTLLETACQLMDSIRPDLSDHMVVNTAGIAEAHLYLCKPTNKGNLYLKFYDAPGPAQDEYDGYAFGSEAVEAEPWLETLLRRVAIGHLGVRCCSTDDLELTDAYLTTKVGSVLEQHECHMFR